MKSEESNLAEKGIGYRGCLGEECRDLTPVSQFIPSAAVQGHDSEGPYRHDETAYTDVRG